MAMKPLGPPPFNHGGGVAIIVGTLVLLLLIGLLLLAVLWRSAWWIDEAHAATPPGPLLAYDRTCAPSFSPVPWSSFSS
jgi:hypothetical protein